MSTTRHGVRLTLPGAPATPHQMPGMPVLVRPDQVTQLEDPADVERVRELIEQGAPVELVELDEQLSGKALQTRAKELDIKGRTGMGAEELRAAVAATEALHARAQELNIDGWDTMAVDDLRAAVAAAETPSEEEA